MITEAKGVTLYNAENNAEIGKYPSLRKAMQVISGQYRVSQLAGIIDSDKKKGEPKTMMSSKLGIRIYARSTKSTSDTALSYVPLRKYATKEEAVQANRDKAKIRSRKRNPKLI